MKILAVILCLVLLSCSDGQFTGAGNGILGGSSDDDNATPEFQQPQPPSNPFGEGDIDSDLESGEGTGRVILDENGEPCVKDIISNKVDFEQFSESQQVASFQNTLMDDYGISIQNLGSTDLTIARVVSENDSEPSFKAWKSILCPKKPNSNQLCFGGDGGKRVLSSSNSLDTKDISFIIHFIAPVNDFAFDLVDLDGNETWEFEFFDAQDNRLDDSTETKESGYGSNSGNSALTNFKFSRDDRLIKKVIARGSKGSKTFGFGFDNFSTGLNKCE